MDIAALAREAQAMSAPAFARIEEIAEYNTRRVADAFRECRITLNHFAPSTGYGYDDVGRDKLDALYAAAFGCEDALVRPHIINGTHALCLMLKGILPPSGGRLLSITGAPYDTLTETIGTMEASGRLTFTQVPFTGTPDESYIEAVKTAIAETHPHVVYIQRSKGYGDRVTLSNLDIRRLTFLAKSILPDVVVALDNCYGEFCEAGEPFGSAPVGFTGERAALLPLDCEEAPCDVAAGSLIKNPGGGIAPCGGYIAGRHDLVEKVAEELTVPGIGREAGCNPDGWRLYFQGFFLAPHTVSQALKTSVFAANLLTLAGFEAAPKGDEPRCDIIQTIRFGDPKPLISFCRGIQSFSPVDSHLTCEPWAMPGYTSEVIMAAGAFVQGSSIELSCDAPIREPYLLYLQGGLTYESGKYAITQAVANALQ
ncbi:MAG: methionine gamma-lyase family protein [Clostridia bacterium]|nr:methionine gamma-lyase family protein [Clostridia bacterium]